MRATAYDFLEKGLIEGLTQVITEDIQTKQGISPLPDRWQVYEEYVPVAREFIRIFTPAVVGDAYFKGDLAIAKLRVVIEQRWTRASFDRVKMFTNQNDQNATEQALRLIGSLEKAYSKRPKLRGPFQWIFR